MNKDEVMILAESFGAHRGTARNVMNGEPIYYIEPTQFLAFANACEKIGMEKAAKIAENEKVDYAATGDLGDLAYNTAIDNVIVSIRAAI